MKVRVSYHGVEVETELPEVGDKTHNGSYVLANTQSQPADKVCLEILKESVKAIRQLQEGRDV